MSPAPLTKYIICIFIFRRVWPNDLSEPPLSCDLSSQEENILRGRTLHIIRNGGPQSPN